MDLMPNKALLPDKFSAALQICRRARRYMLGEAMKLISILVIAVFLFACASVPSGYTTSEEVEAALKGKNKEFVVTTIGAPNSRIHVEDNIESWTYTSFASGLTGGECKMTVTFVGDSVAKTVLNAADRSWVSYPLGSCRNLLKDLKNPVSKIV